MNAFRAKTVETAEAGGAQVIDPRHVFRGLGLEAVLSIHDSARAAPVTPLLAQLVVCSPE